MIPNRSPWLHQLNRTRPIESLETDISTDIAIVGGGIAGITTAYFTLAHTDMRVVVVEGDKVAHGATGHNAGQITSYFERPFAELVDEFGLELASQGQRDVESAWQLIDEIVAKTALTTPVYRFTGYAGCATLEQVLLHLRNNRKRQEGGLPTEAIIVAREWEGIREIPEEYHDLYSLTPHQDLLQLLETDDSRYIAVLAYQKGCTNSARFTEEVAGYLLATYPDRFSLYEHSHVGKVVLEEGGVTLEVNGHTLTAKQVVLCTNGFEHFTIVNTVGEGIDTSFHHSIDGRIGYMAGYLEPLTNSPTAISYFPPKGTVSGDPTGEAYYYLTRRPHEKDGVVENLVCAGGPDSVLPNRAIYSRDAEYREDMHQSLDNFLATTYRHYPEASLEYSFCWHGLMGYTPNGVRRVGYEPRNHALLYNLGCNGVGILPSLYGGKRIAQLLAREELPPSIFDPR